MFLLIRIHKFCVIITNKILNNVTIGGIQCILLPFTFKVSFLSCIVLTFSAFVVHSQNRDIEELRHEKTNILHMRKQRHSSALL